MLEILVAITALIGFIAFCLSFGALVNKAPFSFFPIGFLWCLVIAGIIVALILHAYRKKTGYYERRQQRFVEEQGAVGERKVARYLKRRMKEGEALYNDIVIPNGNNNTAQIDHIFVSVHGVFVIETKNYTGKIYGSENDNQWVECYHYGREKFHFYNPVAQNATHVIAVKKLLRDTIDVPIVSVVIFVDGDISSVNADVYYLDNVKDLFNQYKDVNLSHDDIAEITDVLDAYKAITPKAN